MPARTYSFWCIDASMQHPVVLRAVPFVATRAEDGIILAVQVKQLSARLRRSSGSSAFLHVRVPRDSARRTFVVPMLEMVCSELVANACRRALRSSRALRIQPCILNRVH